MPELKKKKLKGFPISRFTLFLDPFNGLSPLSMTLIDFCGTSDMKIKALFSFSIFYCKISEWSYKPSLIFTLKM